MESQKIFLTLAIPSFPMRPLCVLAGPFLFTRPGAFDFFAWGSGAPTQGLPTTAETVAAGQVPIDKGRDPYYTKSIKLLCIQSIV